MHTRCSRIIPVLVILATASALCGCAGGPNGPVLAPIDVNGRSTISQARLTWYPNAPERPQPGSLSFGVEAEYARAITQGDQTVNANEAITLKGNSIFGPQEVRHHADLRYGHLGMGVIKRFSGMLSGLELEVFAGLGETRLELRSSIRTSTPGTLDATYASSGISLGVGPRFDLTDKLAIEARLQVLNGLPLSWRDRLVYPEIGFRYRPVRNLALRAGYAQLEYTPARNGGDSSINVRARGPFLGLQLAF